MTRRSRVSRASSKLKLVTKFLLPVDHLDGGQRSPTASRRSRSVTTGRPPPRRGLPVADYPLMRGSIRSPIWPCITSCYEGEAPQLAGDCLFRYCRNRKVAIMTPLTSGTTARRMYGLVEPIGLIPYRTAEHAEALLALGLHNYWDTYFAGRVAPLGRDVPAGVVHAIFYNFAPGEAARHPACLGPDHARGRAGGARPRVRRGATADARRPGRPPQRRAGCRPRRQGGHLPPGRGASPLRSAADAAGPGAAACAAVVRMQFAA